MFGRQNLLLTGAPDEGIQADKKAESFDHRRSMLIGVKTQTFMNKYQLLFYLKKQKSDSKTGSSPIYLRISCDKRVEISLNKWVQPEDWNSNKQCISGNSPEARAINAFLKTVEVKFHEIHCNLVDKGELITADTLFLATNQPV